MALSEREREGNDDYLFVVLNQFSAFLNLFLAFIELSLKQGSLLIQHINALFERLILPIQVIQALFLFLNCLLLLTNDIILGGDLFFQRLILCLESSEGLRGVTWSDEEDLDLISFINFINRCFELLL